MRISPRLPARRPRARSLTAEQLEPRTYLTLTILDWEPTATGFAARFSDELDTSALNLYDTQSARHGDADVTLVGQSSGPVTGSLIAGPFGRKLTFIQSGGLLPPDEYVLTVRGTAEGVQNQAGDPFDGDSDGVSGGDFQASFTIGNSAASLSIPDFVRGPGQAVDDLPQGGAGIPVSLNSGGEITAVEFQLSYDPRLLRVSGALPGSDAPSGATVSLDELTPGWATISYAANEPIAAGTQSIVELVATVPETALELYGNQQILDIHSGNARDAENQELPLTDNDGLHLAAYFGDVSGNGSVNAVDAADVARVATLLETGFAVTEAVDPRLSGDITSNDRVNAADASTIARYAALLPVEEIPSIPAADSLATIPYSYENPPTLAPMDPVTTITVGSVQELISAVRDLQSNSTIRLLPGTYNLSGRTQALAIPQGITNWAIRGATGNREDVIITGGSMHGSVRFGIWIGNSPHGLIADLTLRDLKEHGVIANFGAHDILYHNLKIVDVGDQFIKSNPDGFSRGNARGTVAYSVFEYTVDEAGAGGLPNYTNGVDVHGGDGWKIHHNYFRNFLHRPSSGLAGPAILMWNGSRNTLIEANTFHDVARGISLGLLDHSAGFDHQGGAIRNNIFYRRPDLPNRVDVAIHVADSPQTEIQHNTILLAGSYPNAIEYRFPSSAGLDIRNNLTDAAIAARDGALAQLSGNFTTASESLFVNAVVGDFHLAPLAAVINQGVPVAEGTRDIDGQLRDSLPDIGADEYFETASRPAAHLDRRRPLGVSIGRLAITESLDAESDELTLSSEVTDSVFFEFGTTGTRALDHSTLDPKTESTTPRSEPSRFTRR